MVKEMEATIIGYIGTTIRLHSFIPSYPQLRLELGFRVQGLRGRVGQRRELAGWGVGGSMTNLLFTKEWGDGLNP